MSTTQWFRVASHTDKSPSKGRLSAGAAFSLAHTSPRGFLICLPALRNRSEPGIERSGPPQMYCSGQVPDGHPSFRIEVATLVLIVLGHIHCFGRVKRDCRCLEDWSVSRSPNLTFALVVSPTIMMSVSRHLSAISICLRESELRITVQEVRHPGATATAADCLETGAFGVPGSAPHRAQAHIAPLPASSAP